MIEYDYNKFTIHELEEQYNKNLDSISYYEKEVKYKEKYSYIILIITFLFTWGFTLIGLYLTFENSFWSSILSILFIFTHIYCYIHIDVTAEEKEKIEYLKNENEKIKLVLELKGDLANS